MLNRSFVEIAAAILLQVILVVGGAHDVLASSVSSNSHSDEAHEKSHTATKNIRGLLATSRGERRALKGNKGDKLMTGKTGASGKSSKMMMGKTGKAGKSSKTKKGEASQDGTCPPMMMMAIHKNDDGSMEAEEGCYRFDAEYEDAGYKFTFSMTEDGDRAVVVKSSPTDRTIHIQMRSDDQSSLTGEERMFLKCMGDSMRMDQDVDTDTMESMGTQGMRAAWYVMEWPDGMPMEFESTPDMQAQRQAKKDGCEETNNDSSDEVRARRLDTGVISWCDKLGTYQQVTHDDFWYSRYEPETTYMALIADTPPITRCIDDGGQEYSYDDGNTWTCEEPDHSVDLDLARGSCFGRCGGNCMEPITDSVSSGDFIYTKDCADHDACVRGGHSFASTWCQDEFLDTADDSLFGTNCL